VEPGDCAIVGGQRPERRSSLSFPEQVRLAAAIDEAAELETRFRCGCYK
jgi:hypothetical protein